MAANVGRLNGKLSNREHSVFKNTVMFSTSTVFFDKLLVNEVKTILEGVCFFNTGMYSNF